MLTSVEHGWYISPGHQFVLDAFPSAAFSWNQKFCHGLGAGKLAGHQNQTTGSITTVHSSAEVFEDLAVGPVLHRESYHGFFSFTRKKV